MEQYNTNRPPMSERTARLVDQAIAAYPEIEPKATVGSSEEPMLLCKLPFASLLRHFTRPFDEEADELSCRKVST